MLDLTTFLVCGHEHTDPSGTVLGGLLPLLGRRLHVRRSNPGAQQHDAADVLLA